MGSLEREKSIVGEWTAFIQRDRLLRESEREREYVWFGRCLGLHLSI